VPNGSLIGRSRLDLLARSTDNPPAQVEAHREVLARRQPFRHFEYRLLTSEGRNLWLSVGVPYFKADGAFAGYRGLGQVVTERRENEEELARYRAGLESLVRERTQELEEARSGPRRRPPRRALPGQHEPRDSHADERHHRLHPHAV
jgi:PAS domain-containing protein